MSYRTYVVISLHPMTTVKKSELPRPFKPFSPLLLRLHLNLPRLVPDRISPPLEALLWGREKFTCT
jgi:hypothetical protein